MQGDRDTNHARAKGSAKLIPPLMVQPRATSNACGICGCTQVKDSNECLFGQCPDQAEFTGTQELNQAVHRQIKHV